MPKTPFTAPETGAHAIHPRRIRRGYADEHFLSDYRYLGPREDPSLAEVFIYTDCMSYDPGDTVAFRGSTTAQKWAIHIYRDGNSPETVCEATDLVGSFSPTPSDAYMNGCDWPVLYSWRIPDDQRSGFYRVVATCVRGSGERFVHHHFFVVRPTQSTQSGSLLVMLATATWTAYNDWGGANHYFGTWGPNGDEGSPILTLKRPWTRGMLWLPKGAPRIVPEHRSGIGDAPRYPSKEWAYANGYGQYYAAAGWAQFDRHFVTWVESQGFAIDIITQTDLHQRPELLERYTCLATSGHDEYWSWEMRQSVEAFVEAGGGLARFGANYTWQIRLEDSGARQICWKFKAPQEDPFRDGPAKHKLTASWESEAVAWPGASTVGVNGCNGMYASWGGFNPRSSRGFTVYRPDHWIFAGTDLRYADVFGSEANIFGYEVDGLNFTFNQGLPYPVQGPGIPKAIDILAMAPAVLYEHEYEGEGFRYYLGDSDLVGMASLMSGPLQEAKAKHKHGSGMIVSMKRGRGEVVTAGSCEWVMGLTRRDIFTETITRNILTRFTSGA